MSTKKPTSYVTTVWSINTICIIETNTATTDYQSIKLQYAKPVKMTYLAVVSTTVLELLMSLTVYMKEYAESSKSIQQQKKKKEKKDSIGREKISHAGS
jgi:hypothetical protein